MNKLLMIMLTMLLVACGKPATGPATPVGQFVVERLFTVDGCTVHRFYDHGHARYFTNCRGSVGTAYTQSQGKTSQTIVDDIQTTIVR
jgi:hypothetical protein